VDTIAKVRRAFFVHQRKIKAIARDLKLARNTVREIVRAEQQTEHGYVRKEQPRPRLGAHMAALEEMLSENAKQPKRERVTYERMFAELRLGGYAGGYDAVRRYGRAWAEREGERTAEAYVPLVFAPGEAYQFDWSHEIVILAGVPTKAKVAQVRLCHSRMPFVRAYPRESQEMVFDAHEKAFQFFKGGCQRGIYDNMRTAVETVFVGRARAYNRRFLQLCSHHLVEPVACTPAAGWEKGQVENQVGTIRDLLFRPKPKVKTLDELNGWLAEQCIAYAKRTRHPELRERTVWEVFEEERASLMPFVGPFAGFVEKPMRATVTCLVTHDRNRYSVDARAAGRAVLVRTYADRIVVLFEGEVVADHPRSFKRDQFVFDPWHYLPVLLRKPGALRNGAPFKDWALPPGLAKVRAKLQHHHDGDRQFVKVLGRVPEHGIAAVEDACTEALDAGIANGDVIIAILARRQQPPTPPSITTPDALKLTAEPVADCARYDALRPRKETPQWSATRSSRP